MINQHERAKLPAHTSPDDFCKCFEANICCTFRINGGLKTPSLSYLGATRMQFSANNACALTLSRGSFFLISALPFEKFPALLSLQSLLPFASFSYAIMSTILSLQLPRQELQIQCSLFMLDPWLANIHSMCLPNKLQPPRTSHTTLRCYFSTTILFETHEYLARSSHDALLHVSPHTWCYAGGQNTADCSDAAKLANETNGSSTSLISASTPHGGVASEPSYNFDLCRLLFG